MSYSKIFPSFKEIYAKVSNPPDQHPAEHPYEYIIRVYENKSMNSKLTGLPGYSPPWPIRILNGLSRTISFAVIISVIMFFVVGLCTAGAFLIESISNVVFTLDIPFTGWTVLEISKNSKIVATPVFVSFILFWMLSMVFMGINRVSLFFSEPYEDEYEEWLQELKPPDSGFPAGLAYAYRDDFEFEPLPTAAPPVFRETRRIEKMWYIILTVFYAIGLFITRTLFMHQMIMLPQNSTPVEKEIDRQETISERNDRYS